MKIGILLTGRFPTEKAYGVTTSGTVKALVRAGHEVIVFGTKSNYVDASISSEEYTLENYVESCVANKIKEFAYRGNGMANKVSWIVFWILTMKSSKKKIDSMRFDVIWIRDSLMLSHVTRKTKVIFEVHQLVKRFSLITIRRFSKGNLLLAPISKVIASQLIKEDLGIPIQIAPMGISLDIIESDFGVNNYLNHLKNLHDNKYLGLRVGYIGKFSPNGYSKGVEDLLGLAKINSRLESNFRISLVGGTDSEILQMNSKLEQYGITTKEIEISGHVGHAKAIKMFKQLDVIVLPKPASQKYVGFPLKAIESIASGRVVVAAKCTVYEDIFDQDFQPFWYTAGDSASLNMAIRQAVNEEGLRLKLNSGLNFALKFSWDDRTSRLLDALIC